MADNFALVYASRSDSGPRFVGPFRSREDAEDHADSLAAPGWQASYSVVRLTPPASDQRQSESFVGPPISGWSPAPWELS
jgi:hypothetical protein